MVDNPEAASAAPAVSWPSAFWRILKRIDKTKLNTPGLALRNSLAVAIPLGLSIELGNPLAAVAIATGALNVAYSDGVDPYAHRARRMLGWTFLGAVAVFLGSITGNYPLLAITIAAGWAFGAGLLVSISGRAADLGLNTLVTLVVYAARGALSPLGALYAGLLVLAGGLLQTLIALLSWPLRRSAPERRAVGSVYLNLASDLKTHPDEFFVSSLKQISPELQDTLSALGRDHSQEGERLRLLLDQTERLRFSMYNVIRLRAALAREPDASRRDELTSADVLDRLTATSCTLLESIGWSLIGDDPAVIAPETLVHLRSLLDEAQQLRKNSPIAAHIEFASAADLLAGQLRMVSQLASHMTSAGAEDFARAELAPPLKLQLRSWLDTLRANLHFRSPAFRHAVRLAVCVAIGDVIGRSSGVQRNYWFAMTVAVVLKPDFNTTISRGVLRLIGTFTGLMLATVLYHLLPPSAFTQLVLVGLFTFFMRYVGPANYGIFSLAISGLIVFLLATTGVAPAEVVGERAINTAGGGIFALIAYALWPTWERTQVSEVIAEMIDRTRDYFHAVTERFSHNERVPQADLDRTRDEWRQARSNAEASVDRLSAEPGTDPARLDTLTSILSSSHALVRIVMSLEAGIGEAGPRSVPQAFEGFSHDVEFTLYFLSAALRGSASASQTLPQLREDHRRIEDEYKNVAGTDDFILVETDRLTVSLNTLREQVIRYRSLVHQPASSGEDTTANWSIRP